MRRDERPRCGRCGSEPFAAGEPYTWWIWVARDGVVEEHALHLCRPCGRDFPGNESRYEYLRLGFFG